MYVTAPKENESGLFNMDNGIIIYLQTELASITVLWMLYIGECV